MDYRLIHPKKTDIEGLKRLWKVCFPDDGEEFIDYYFAERTRLDYMLAVRSDEIVSMLHVIPMRFSVRSLADGSINSLPVGFIAGVATSPLHRKRGLANMLLREAASDIARREGYAALILSPENESFYLHAGYRTLSRRAIHTIGAEDFNRRYSGSFRNVQNGDRFLTATGLSYIYDSYMRKGSLTCFRERTEECFCSLLHEYSLPGGVTAINSGAYALGYRAQNAGKSEIALNEFAYIDEESAYALIAFLLKQADTVKLPLPVSSTLLGKAEAVFALNMAIPIGDEFYRALGCDDIDEYSRRMTESGFEPYSFELY